jgi:hypothetical protein
MAEILLNYGIEIECVFELLDEIITLQYFIHLFQKKEDNDTKENFNEMIQKLLDLIKSISKFIKINDNKTYNDLLKFKEDNEEKTYYDFFREKIEFIIQNAEPIAKEEPEIKKETDEFINFIKNLNKFINEIIQLIIEIIKNDTSKYKKLKDIFLKEGENMKEIFKTRFDLIDNRIQIYYEKDVASQTVMDEMSNDELSIQYKIMKKNIDLIKDFFDKSKETDEVKLLLTEDGSVVCHKSIIYKDIKSAKTVDYKLLLNRCEFITQVFSNPDDVKQKLDIFFKNNVIKKTILNCLLTSNHVHISFNKDDKIIKPDIRTIFIIVVICNFFQDKIFKLFLKSRTNNIYCKKIEYNDSSFAFILEDNDKKIIFKDDQYDLNLIKILSVFFGGEEDEITICNIKNYRYHWLNLVNLFDIRDIESTRPPTIEFRIKHGSADAEELKNVCKLYENIINEAIRLTNIITHEKKDYDIDEFKKNIEDNIENYDYFNDIILNNSLVLLSIF